MIQVAARRLPIEAATWLFIAAVAATCMLTFRPDPLSNDSYQYLNTAEHIRNGQGAVTSLIYWDAERSFGRLPAPVTHFPPGYPGLVAMLAGRTGSLDRTARGISTFSFAMTAAILVVALKILGIHVAVRTAAMMLFVANMPSLTFATSALAEALFTSLLTASVATLLSVEMRGNAVGWKAVFAFTAAGAACWIRYAGFFFVAGLVSWALLRLSKRQQPVLVAGVIVSLSVAAPLLWRNWTLTGSWTGGHDKFVPHAIADVPGAYLRAQAHVIGGAHAAVFGIWEILFVAAAGSLLVCGMMSWRALLSLRSSRVALLLICAAVYSAAMVYVGSRTFTEFSSRLFVPLLPIYLMLLALALNKMQVSRQKVFLASLAALIAGYAGVNARDLREALQPAEHRVIAAQLSAPAADGNPLRSWIDLSLKPQEPIFTQLGQAAGYLLGRPTIALAQPYFSRVEWDCTTIRTEMQRFRSRRLLLFRPTSGVDASALLSSNRVVQEAVGPGQPPCGFVIAAENANARILEPGVPSERAESRHDAGRAR